MQTEIIIFIHGWVFHSSDSLYHDLVNTKMVALLFLKATKFQLVYLSFQNMLCGNDSLILIE